ncbi:MAG: PAS domain S-box protein [Mariprofundaceae bacterium]
MSATWWKIFSFPHNESRETKRVQVSIAYKIMVCFTPVLLGFAIFNWNRDHQTLAIIEASVVCVLIFSITWVWQKYDYILPILSSMIIFLLGTIVFIDGGVGKMAVLWLSLNPFLYFTLMGQRWGWIFSLSHLFCILLIKNIGSFDIVYDQTQMFVFTLAYTFQTLVAAMMNFYRVDREGQLITREQSAHITTLQTQDFAKQEADTWQASMDCIADAILIVGADGKVIKTNQSAKQLNPAIDQKLSCYCHQLLHKQCQSCDVCLMKRACASNQHTEDEIFIEATNKWWLVSVHPLKQLGHIDKRTIIMLKDITRKHQQLKVQKEELRHFQHMEHVNLIISGSNKAEVALLNLMTAIRTIFKSDRAWILSPCDPQAESWYVPFESAVDTYPCDFFDLEGIPMDDDTREIFSAALATEAPVTFPAMPDIECIRKYSIKSQMIIAIHAKVGTPWLLGIHQCSHATDWDGKQKELFKDISIRISDILDACRLNEFLDRRTDQYRQLIENMPDAVIIIADQCIVFANEVMLNMVGVGSIKDIVGKTLAAFLHPDCRQVDVENFTSGLRGGKCLIDAVKLINKEGDSIDVVTTNVDISFHGKPAVQIILRNVTRRNKRDKELQQLLDQNKKMAHKLINIQEQERKTLAQNLHDDSGQILTAMSANLQSIKKHTRSDKVLARLDDTSKMIDYLFQSIRSSLATLNSTHIDTLGLTGAIRSEIEAWSSRHHIKAFAEVSQAANFPCPETATAIYRIIQEALTNIAKHANAKHVWISLGLSVNDPSCITLGIKDDGCGFDTSQTSREGFGLFGMRSRAEIVSAVLTISSSVGKGTSLHVDFPVNTGEGFDGGGGVKNEQRY